MRISGLGDVATYAEVVMRFFHRPVRALFCICLVVHVGLLLAVDYRSGSIDAFAFKSLDAQEYYQLAINIKDHAAFSQAAAPPYDPDTWRTPGYPIFLAACMVLLGDSATGLVIAQQLLSILNVVLLAWIAKRFLSPSRTLVVGLLFLIEPYHHWYSLWLLPGTLFTTLMLGVWLVWNQALEKGVLWRFVLLGLLCGFSTLVWPVGALVPLILVGALVVSLRRRCVPLGRLVPRVGLFVVSVGVILASWMGRNAAVAGRFALSHQDGVVLAYFKATEVVLWRLGRSSDRYAETSLDPARADQPHTVWEDIDAKLRNRFAHLSDEDVSLLRWQNLAQGNRTHLDSFEVAKALRSIGWSYLLEDPLRTTSCYLARCAGILTFPLNLAVKPAAGVEVNRLRAAVLGMPYLVLCLWILVRLASTAFEGWWVRRGGPTLHLRGCGFPLMATLALLLAVTPQLDPRFRVPMMPMLLFLALLPESSRQRLPPNRPAVSSLLELGVQGFAQAPGDVQQMGP